MSLMNKINVAVIGATGYTGLDLIYLLSANSKVNIISLCATKNLGKNIRAIQDLGNRSVFYNSGKTVELKERDQVKSNDKFLRCKKKETVDFTKPPLVKQEIQEDLNIGMSDSTKKYVKNIFILLNILTIFINALFLTLYLSKYEYAQKFIVTIVGTQKLGSPNILKIWRNSGKCI